MTSPSHAAPSQGDGARPAVDPSPRQMQAAEPPRLPQGGPQGPGYPAAFGSGGGAVVFRDYASI